MQPFKFTFNRVWRVYRGGLMIDKMRNSETRQDSCFPEDWIASTVTAANPPGVGGSDGISTALTAEGEVPFNKLLEHYPIEMLGEKHFERFGASTGFLAKLLDSAIRLPIQVHPDNETAQRLYNSKYGKTEAWLVLDTREIDGEAPYLLLGFNDKLDAAVFKAEALTGEMPQSLSMVHKHNVKAGDVIMIRGGMVHAIGSGVFMLEIMEPTDFVVQPEKMCGTQPLSQSDRYGNLSPESALTVFDFRTDDQDTVRNNCFINPKVKAETAVAALTTLIDRNEIKFFGAEKLLLNGVWEMSNDENICRAGVVIRGNMALTAEDITLHLKPGETFFIPACVKNIKCTGNAETIFILPPLS